MSPNPQSLLVVPAKSGHHRQSFVILHGRGSNGNKFGSELLATHIPGYGLLQDVFPDARIIFPTAAKRRAKIYKRTPIHQWFDNWSLDSPTERDELQIDGLRDNSTVIHELIETEIAVVGAPNVILWGLSQGCAASLIASMLWQQPPFAATIGMCGWLPLRHRMEHALVTVSSEEPNPFSAYDSQATRSNIDEAVAYLRDELDLRPGPASEMLPTLPVFLGHGAEDDRVPIALARDANAFLSRLGINVQYEEYEDLAHWYSGYMLRDIVRFIQSRVGWPLGPAPA